MGFLRNSGKDTAEITTIGVTKILSIKGRMLRTKHDSEA